MIEALSFLASLWETALTNVFMPSLFLLVNTREPQSMNATLVLPTIRQCRVRFYAFVGQPQLYTAVLRKVVQQNRTRQYRKVLWVMGVHGSLTENLGVLATKRETVQTSIFMPLLSLLINTVNLNQSTNAKPTPNSFYP